VQVFQPKFCKLEIFLIHLYLISNDHFEKIFMSIQLGKEALLLPEEIEKASMAIIAREAGEHGFSTERWAVVSRMIHTSADFEYLHSVRFHPRAVESGISALLMGRSVITDTNMVLAGLRKKDLDGLGCPFRCYIDDPEAIKLAARKGSTRAEAAVDRALPDMEQGIYVVGNAPTALLRLINLLGQGRAAPALIVGLPVGFVNAVESKDLLAGLDVPFITNKGRKGGSNVAAAVVNSLIILARKQR